MVSRRNNKQQVEGIPQVISAPTLKEAHKIVRRKYGKNALILSTRTISRRQEMGLGQEKMVEVVVMDSTGTANNAQGSYPKTSASNVSSSELTHELNREVERIEALVQDITARQATMNDDSLAHNPLAESLITAGASAPVVSTLLTRFTSETGKDRADRVGALTWLKDQFPASNCGWDGFYGYHAFLGHSGAGRTDLVLEAAAKLQQQGRRTLVLSIMPSDPGAIKRLQREAGKQGYDAAIISKESQLSGSENHMSQYDVVLLDMPALDHPALRPGGRLHSWLATNPGFHRHILVPLDMDFQDLSEIKAIAKEWNCDWVVISRIDRSQRPGKIIDLYENIPLPISLTGMKSNQVLDIKIASSDGMLDMALGVDFVPGNGSNRFEENS
jgi:flagellar biosynthesis GTPase FlhF